MNSTVHTEENFLQTARGENNQQYWMNMKIYKLREPSQSKSLGTVEEIKAIQSQKV